MAGYVILGLGFGILLRNAGYGVGWALAMDPVTSFRSFAPVSAGAFFCDSPWIFRHFHLFCRVNDNLKNTDGCAVGRFSDKISI